MFDYFYYSVIKPIEVTLKTDVVRPGMQGHLLYTRKAKILGGLTNKVKFNNIPFYYFLISLFNGL